MATSITEHKIIGLVVHGVGEQKRGSTLKSFVQNFFPLIRKQKGVVRAGIDVRPIDDKAQPQVRLSFTRETRDKQTDRLERTEKYEILVQEVHWAEAFVPPSFGGVLSGLFELLTTWLRRALPARGSAIMRSLHILWWLFLRMAGNAGAVLLMIITAPLALLVALSALVAGWKHKRWRPMQDLMKSYADFQPQFVELVIFLLSPLLVVAFIALVILEAIGPLRQLLPSWVGKVREMIVRVATSHLGDVWAYAGQPWEASQMRTRFEKRFMDLVDSESANAESMFVIAHSLGCPVSYEALSGRRMKQFMQRKFVGGGRSRPKLNFYYFTVGSALPAIFRVIPDEERRRLHRKLPSTVSWWADFAATYDPVRFKLILDRVTHVPDEQGNPQPIEHLVTSPAYHPVTNQMDLFSDHTTYWNNTQEVIEPILKQIKAI